MVAQSINCWWLFYRFMGCCADWDCSGLLIHRESRESSILSQLKALARNQAHSIRRNALKRISIDSEEELIEEVETEIFQSENKFGKWYWID